MDEQSLVTGLHLNVSLKELVSTSAILFTVIFGRDGPGKGAEKVKTADYHYYYYYHS